MKLSSYAFGYQSIRRVERRKKQLPIGLTIEAFDVFLERNRKSLPNIKKHKPGGYTQIETIFGSIHVRMVYVWKKTQAIMED